MPATLLTLRSALAILVVALASLARAGEPPEPGDPRSAPEPTAGCPTGRSITADTAGHCCFGDQAWSSLRARCVGVPSCPSGMAVRDESCARVAGCGLGQEVSDDTDGHCCYPGQVWSKLKQRCLGIPRCEEGFLLERGQCIPHIDVALEARRAGLVPVIFRPRSERYRYHVEVGHRGCDAPCRLYLPPGPARMEVTGDGAFGKDLVIPTRPASMFLQHAATPELIAGAVLLSVGTAMLLANAAIPSCFSGDNAFCIAPIIAFGWAIGPVTYLTGAILLFVGLGRLPGTNSLRPTPLGELSARPRQSAPFRLISLGASPSQNGGAASALFAF